MNYAIVYEERALRQLKKLDKSVLAMIKAWIEKNLIDTQNPRRMGKSLVGNHSGQWRYRVGDYRILADIIDDERTVVIVAIGHRREIYD